MEPKRPDRRVVRTRRRLKEALLGLIREQPYDAVTVQDIIDRADVGRSTFYSHFRSKEELLFDGFGQAFEAFKRHGHPSANLSGDPQPRPYAFSKPLLNHFRVQSRFFLATLRETTDPKVRREVTKWLAESIQADLLNRHPTAATRGKAPLRLAAQAHCIAAAFLGLAGWWLEKGQDLTADEVDQVFRATLAE